MKASWLAGSPSYRVATRRHCLIVFKNRSTKLRARYRYEIDPKENAALGGT
jgi:hypothetical protein